LYAAEWSPFAKNYATLTSRFGYAYPSEYAMRIHGASITDRQLEWMGGLGIAGMSLYAGKVMGRLPGLKVGAIDGLRSSTGVRADLYARQIAEKFTHVYKNPNRLVLGKWEKTGGYIGEAKTNGGVWYESDSSFFSKLTEGLDSSVGQAKAWKVNEQLLKGQLENGIGRIDLHGETIREVLTNRPNSFTAMEIKYLETNANNYDYVRKGNSWIKVK